MSGTRVRQSFTEAISLAKEIGAAEGVPVSVCRTSGGKWSVTWWSDSNRSEHRVSASSPQDGRGSWRDEVEISPDCFHECEVVLGQSSHGGMPFDSLGWEKVQSECLAEEAIRHQDETPAGGGYSSSSMTWSNPYRGMTASVGSSKKSTHEASTKLLSD
jgi:hypothetical protein